MYILKQLYLKIHIYKYRYIDSYSKGYKERNAKKKREIGKKYCNKPT